MNLVAARRPSCPRTSASLLHPRLAAAAYHFANDPGPMTGRMDEPQCVICALVRDDYDHTDAHVEDLIKLRVRDFAFVLNQSKDWQHVPRTLANNNVAVLRQHARDIVDETAAGDRSQGANRVGRTSSRS